MRLLTSGNLDLVETRYFNDESDSWENTLSVVKRYDGGEEVIAYWELAGDSPFLVFAADGPMKPDVSWKDFRKVVYDGYWRLSGHRVVAEKEVMGL